MREKRPYVYYRPATNKWYWSPSKHSKKVYGPFDSSKEAQNSMEDSAQ